MWGKKKAKKAVKKAAKKTQKGLKMTSRDAKKTFGWNSLMNSLGVDTKKTKKRKKKKS